MLQGENLTIFFNLETLERESCDIPQKFVQLLWYHYQNKLLYHSDPRIRKLKTLTGYSFIINPEKLFNDRSTDILYKVQYIKLAARRDYYLYVSYDYRGLDLSFHPDINIETIITNPLLKIKHREILFKYEELQWH